MKRIIVCVAHPAQYHFIKYTVRNLNNDGNQVKILIRTKDVLEQLLQEGRVDYVNIQPVYRKNTKFSMIMSVMERARRIYQIAKAFNADAIVGTDAAGVYAAWFLGIPSLVTLEDDYEIIKAMARNTYPISTDIIVPSVCNVGKWNDKKTPYYGYMKLAYLHPHYFTPDENVVKRYGIGGKYCLLRVSKLTAYHDDVLCGGIKCMIESVLQVGHQCGYAVYISSEGEIEPSLKPYQLKIRFTDIHHLLAYSSLLISDSQSMSVEAAMLGVPSLRFSDFAGRISVLEELENKYRLTFGIRTSEPEVLLSKEKELLSQENLRNEYHKRRDAMLSEKIDVTAFLTWYIGNYPESKRIMKENPDFQYSFK